MKDSSVGHVDQDGQDGIGSGQDCRHARAGGVWCGGCRTLARLNPFRLCRRKRPAMAQKDFWALRGPRFRIQRGSLFCLLGCAAAAPTSQSRLMRSPSDTRHAADAV